MRCPSRAAIQTMIEEATVDCYNDSECATGLHTMLDEHLDVPFQARVLGVDVTVTGIDITDDDQIVAICHRGPSRQPAEVGDESGGHQRDRPLVNMGERRIRLTDREAQLSLRTVLRLCAAGTPRCSEKAARPSSATIATVASHLVDGDF